VQSVGEPYALGFFMIRDSVDMVAAVFGVTRLTICNCINTSGAGGTDG
jgi:hypothetical protein